MRILCIRSPGVSQVTYKSLITFSVLFIKNTAAYSHTWQPIMQLKFETINHYTVYPRYYCVANSSSSSRPICVHAFAIDVLIQ